MTQDDTQSVVAASTSANLLVVAPPGCGKTELLALRALALIPRLLPHQRILALTFTNRAKANLNERLRRLLGIQRFRRYVSVRNYHGHAAEIVLAHGSTIGLNVASLVMPTSKTMRRALLQFSADPAANRAAAELISATKRAALADDEVLAALAVAGDKLARRVESERVASNGLHYDDLLRHAQRLLMLDEVANLYQQHYGAVLVDEFQDLSLQQLDLVLRSCTTSRTFAGDPLQGIFSWAGADPIQVEARLRKLCGEPIQLTVSYRSSPAVLAMLNGVSGRMGAKALKSFDTAAWPGGGVGVALAAMSTRAEAQLIVGVSKRVIESNPNASLGVITRSGWRRGAIDRAFADWPALPCRRWDLAIDDPVIFDRLRAAIARMPADISPNAARDRVLAGVDPSDVDTAEQIEDVFEQLASSGAENLHRTLSQLKVRDPSLAVGPGVHLLNAHTGKGQQFDWVFIPGLEEKHLPDSRNRSDSALAEEERVLLVMLSRARHGVIVTKAGTLDGKYGPYASTPSRWWAQLKASATTDLNALKSHLDEYYPGA